MQSNLFEFNEGKCVGLYVIDPSQTLFCTQRTLQKHLVAEGEEAFDYDLRNSTGQGFGRIIKVDLPNGSYIIRYSSPSFLQGFSQVLQSAGYDPAEYIRQ